MDDIIEKWIQRKSDQEDLLNSLANEPIMDDEDAASRDAASKQLELIKEIINDLQHYI